jgi:signal transduction histidine kinase
LRNCGRARHATGRCSRRSRSASASSSSSTTGRCGRSTTASRKPIRPSSSRPAWPGRWVSEAVPGLERRWYETYGRIALSGKAERFENYAAPFNRWYDVFAFRTGEPQERRVAILFNDITERKRAEGELLDLNNTLERRVTERTAELRLLASIVESTDGEIQALGLDYRWLAINAACVKAYERVFGISPRTGDSLPELLKDHPEELRRATAVWGRALAGEQFSTLARWGEQHHGGRTYDMRFELLRDGDGKQIGAFLTGTDITDRLKEQARLEEAEAQVRQLQKMEALGQLTGGIAHDFNNMLTIIKASAEFLRKPTIDDARRKRFADAVADTADRAAKLTGQLLAFARKQALKPEVFDVGERLLAIAGMLDSLVGGRIAIVTDLADSNCFVEADASQFETALVNMAVNARDAMGGEGRLTISARRKHVMPHEVDRGGDGPEAVAVAITDTGTGIAPEALSKIFEPFFTTKDVGKGTGLGLSQVYGFAKQSGGGVAVTSTIGIGTTFTLYLPAVDPAGRPPHPVAGGDRQTHIEGRALRILIVEDNLDVGRFSSQILRDLGYRAEWVTSAAEALRRLASEARFDVVFSDVVMPGMSGIELGLEIRKRHPNLPVVLTSGYSEVLAEEGRHGFELIQKPYAPDDVVRVLQRVVGVQVG